MSFSQSSRALVLSAVASSSGSLDRLVYTMDYLNRAWPSDAEFEWAVQYLLGTGLIEERAPLHFSLTKEGKKLWQRTRGKGAIQRFIELVDLLPSGEQAEWTLDREAYNDAIQDYAGS